MNGNSLREIVSHERPCINVEATKKREVNRVVKKNSEDGRKVRP